ncbi:SDR family oxidoreductase [Desmospora profundinema]|uniref:NADP-dependent 3-hydroxy acid dehydrogenase YdfG n=1 Tax=Desmospora profundinema TaxID=1571184 RepID=A0ABU1IUL8_9BACL|nr:SDR family NAD(P)-dependent oxidoreductase [Desmospora profundinema]MDR6227609.1 NADP-dependent 3-hydroxy acid dehydrogenase YdfG [Desmospora profundinema]
MRLKNKTAIITGASRGIGEAIAVAFSREGADSLLVGRSEFDLERVAERVRESGRKAVPFPADVTREADVDAAVSRALDEFGKVDILINNAGIGSFKSIKDISLDEWEQVIRVNLTGSFLFAKAVLDPMIDRGQGQIIHISSDVGVRTIPKGAAYCASKFGLEGLSGALSKEVRKLGIRVGSIRPGMTDTYFNDTKQGASEKEGWLEAEDVAEAALYMASAPRHVVVDELMLHPVIQEY